MDTNGTDQPIKKTVTSVRIRDISVQKPAEHPWPLCSPVEQMTSPRRVSYIISIWAEPRPGASPVWRGVLETPDGHRAYFHRLADLNRLLGTMGGWADPPEADVPPEDAGKPPAA